MNRRRFLMQIGGVAVAIPAVLSLSACGSDDDGGSVDAAPATEFSIASGGPHVHDLVLQCSDVNGSSDVTYTSSTGASHSHSVTITAAQLAMIASGSTVTITINEGHMHDWVISKPASAC